MNNITNTRRIWKKNCSEQRYTFMNLPSFESYVSNETVEYVVDKWALYDSILRLLIRALNRDYE